MIFEQDIVESKENLSIELKTKLKNVDPDNKWGDNYTKVKLIRNLENDTFELEINRPNIEDAFGKKLIFYPFVNINNNFQFAEKDFKDKYKARVNGDLYYRIPSGLLDNKKFTSIKELYVGLIDIDNSNDDIYMQMMKFNFKKINKNINLKDNQVGKIKAVKQINIEPKNNSIFGKYNLFFKTFEMYYVPKQIDRRNYIENIANIYLYSEVPNKREDELLIDENVIHSSGCPRGLKTKFVRSISNKKLVINKKSYHELPKLIGSIKIIDPTYYDYEKGKTIIGYSAKSKIGEIIPYNFFGSYNWSNILNIFSSFKKFSFNISKDLSYPILDYINGTTELKLVEKNKFSKKAEMIFDIKDIEFIRNNKNISLKKLKRISYEKNL